MTFYEEGGKRYVVNLQKGHVSNDVDFESKVIYVKSLKVNNKA